MDGRLYYFSIEAIAAIDAFILWYWRLKHTHTHGIHSSSYFSFVRLFSLIVFCKAIFLRCINSTFAIIDLLEIHLNPGIYTIWLQAWEETKNKKKKKEKRKKLRFYHNSITIVCTNCNLCVTHWSFDTTLHTSIFLCMDKIWWIIQTRQIEIWSRYIIGIEIWKWPSIKKVMFNYFERFVDRKTHRLLNWSKWIVGKMYALGTVIWMRKNTARVAFKMIPFHLDVSRFLYFQLIHTSDKIGFVTMLWY